MTPSREPPVLYEQATSLARITLHRPAVLHAMNDELLRDLAGALERAAAADIEFLHGAAPLEVRELARLAVAMNARIESLGRSPSA